MRAHAGRDERYGPDHPDTVESVGQLIELYEAWHAAEPNAGYDTEAAGVPTHGHRLRRIRPHGPETRGGPGGPG